MAPVSRSIAAVILAAGLGTRMKSNRAKVLHPLKEHPMIRYVVETAAAIVGDRITLVVGHQADEVKSSVSHIARVTCAYQARQLGTGHAVSIALPSIADDAKDVVILYGDVPLLTAATIRRLVDDHLKARRDITVLGVGLENPTGYGRIVQDAQGAVLKIVEEADASDREKQIRMINTGIYCVKKDCLVDTLKRVSNDNAQGEYYLTDIIEIGNHLNKNTGAVYCEDADEVIGINTLKDLAFAEALLDKRLSKTS